ncbi:MAG: MATE family efflux transporter [Bacteroidetes bacterium]|nr:MATE family efflux transporter [Bacteroidota bacterium]
MAEATQIIARRARRTWHLLKRALSGEEQEYTSGSIDRAIVMLSIPMVLEMAMESLFAVADAFFVSKIGVDAVATVGLTESVLTLLYSLAIGLSSAATAMVSRRIGAGDVLGAGNAAGQTIILALLISLGLAVPGYFWAHWVLLEMSESPVLAESGKHFTQILFTCNMPIVFLWVLNGILRGAGDAATAMRTLWIANAVNLVLDPLFIFGFGPIPAIGVSGAAIATTAGRSVGVLYQFWILFGKTKAGHLRGNRIHVRTRDLYPNFEIMLRLLRLMAGSTGQFLIGSASWIFMNKILAHLGASVTAGYTIALRIIIFTLMPSWGMANAAATLVGQNLGAGRPDRAEKSVWRAAFFNFLFMTFVGAVYILCAPFLIKIFTNDPEVVENGSMALRTISFGYLFYGCGMVLAQAINGAGDTVTPTWINFICFWVLEMPLAWWLALKLNWGQTGVYVSIVIAESLLTVLAFLVFRTGRWKKVKV